MNDACIALAPRLVDDVVCCLAHIFSALYSGITMVVSAYAAAERTAFAINT